MIQCTRIELYICLVCTIYTETCVAAVHDSIVLLAGGAEEKGPRRAAGQSRSECIRGSGGVSGGGVVCSKDTHVKRH